MDAKLKINSNIAVLHKTSVVCYWQKMLCDNQ